jgi:hypothetical protein
MSAPKIGVICQITPVHIQNAFVRGDRKIHVNTQNSAVFCIFIEAIRFFTSKMYCCVLSRGGLSQIKNEWETFPQVW